jgi:hypothetical protein
MKKMSAFRNVGRVLFLSMLFLLLSSFFVSAVDDLITLQGNVQQSGVNLASGNLTIYVYDTLSGGNLIYNSTLDATGYFNNSIVDGKYDVLLGNNSANQLTLEYGEKYYIEMYVNDEIFSFNGSARQVFQSSVGKINGTHINPGQINVTHIDGNLSFNPFDQDLNISSGVAFADLNVTSILRVGSTLLTADNAGTLNISGTTNFNNGWQSGGVTVSGGNIFVQTLYAVNITSLGVSDLEINGTLLPDSLFNNTFDIGNASLVWRDGFFGRDLRVDGNVGIGTGSPTHALNVFGTANITGGINLSTYISCTALETDADGNLLCGSDGGASSWTFSNSLIYNVSNGTKIGLGLAVPQSSLHINTSISALNITINDTNPVFQVDGVGNIGIGTSIPEGPLHIVSNNTPSAITIEENSGGETFQIGVDSNGNLEFHAGDNYNASYEFLSGGSNPARLTIGPGAGSGFTRADILLQVQTTGRGMGIYTHSIDGQDNWYFGLPYSEQDAFVINRRSTASATHQEDTADDDDADVSNFLYIDNAGLVTIPNSLTVTGDVTASTELNVDDIAAPSGTLDFSNDLVTGLAGLRIGDSGTATDNDLHVVAEITAATMVASTSISLGDDDNLNFGASNDAKIFWDNTNGVLSIQVT